MSRARRSPSCQRVFARVPQTAIIRAKTVWQKAGAHAVDEMFAIKFFGALFAIMNPLVNLPIFLGMTESMSVAEQRAIARRTVFYAAILCAIIIMVGKQILDLFGIDIDSFRTAGGIVLAGIGWNMLNGTRNTSHTGTSSEREQQANVENVAFYPLAFPIVVGPGTMTALLVFREQASSAANMAAYLGVTALVLAMLAVTLTFASNIGAHLSQTLRVIMTRVMGMILLAIAVQMVVEGLIKLLPGLAG